MIGQADRCDLVGADRHTVITRTCRLDPAGEARVDVLRAGVVAAAGGVTT